MTSLNSKQSLTITNPNFLVDGSDAEFRSLINLMLYFSARLLSVRDGFGTLIGLSGIQYSILMSVKGLSLEEEVTVNQLAEHLHLSGSFVTIETGKLQARGLIEKKRHHLDGRKIVLSVTKEGKKLLNTLNADQQSINDILFDKLSASEFKMLSGVMAKLATNCDVATLEIGHLVSKLAVKPIANSRAVAKS